MSISSLQKPLFGLALAGFLLSVTFFCHFFSMGDHLDMNMNRSQETSTISTKSTPCCYSQASPQIFLDRLSATQPLSQALINVIIGFISLAGLIYVMDLWNSRERSRYKYYRDKTYCRGSIITFCSSSPEEFCSHKFTTPKFSAGFLHWFKCICRFLY